MEKVSRLHKRFRLLDDGLAVLFLALVGLGYFWKVLFNHQVPIPADTLVGLYHPWRDAYAQDFPQGVAYKNFLITDPIRQQMPWRKLVIEQWSEDGFVGWDPASFGGSPLSVNIQSGAWYPINVIFSWFEFVDAWSFLIVFQVVGFLLLSYSYFRTIKLHPVASIFGSIMIGFSGFSIAWLTWGTIVSTVMWLPLLLLAHERFVVSNHGWKQLFWFICLLVGYYLSLTAGHMQLFFYVVLITLSYSVFSFFQSKYQLKTLAPIGAGLIVAGLTYSWLLVPYAQFWSQSTRFTGQSYWQVEGFFIPLKHMFQWLIPDLYGNPATLNYWGTWNYGEMIGYVGIVGLLFGCLGASVVWKQKYLWLGIVILSLVLGSENLFSKLPFQWQVPVWSSLQPSRLVFLVGFGLSVTAAHAINSYIASGIRKITLWFVFGLLLAGLCVAFVFLHQFSLVTVEQQQIGLRNMILPSILLLLVGGLLVVNSRFIVQKRDRIILLLIGFLPLLILDMYRFGFKFTPFVSYDYVFSQTSLITFLQQQPQPFRIMTVDASIMPANTHAFYGLEAIGGYNPLYSQRYGTFIEVFENERLSTGPASFRRIIEPTRYQSALLPYSDIEYVLSKQPLQADNVNLVFSEGETLVYQTNNNFGRWYLANALFFFKPNDDAALLQAMLDYDDDGLPAFIESTSDFSVTESNAADVELVEYGNNSHVLKVSSEKGAYLVSSTAYDRGWQATIDDQPTQIYRTNFLFMGILVLPGEHLIEFIYDP